MNVGRQSSGRKASPQVESPTRRTAPPSANSQDADTRRQPIVPLGWITLKTAIANITSPRSAFVRRDFQLLRSFTFRVRSALPASGCFAAWQTTKNDGLPHGSFVATAGSRINHHLHRPLIRLRETALHPADLQTLHMPRIQQRRRKPPS